MRLTLYKKIGKENLSKIKGQDVYAIIDNKEVLMTLKRKTDGTLYLTPKETEQQESSVEIRVFNHSNNKVAYKRLMKCELGILKELNLKWS
ncbi:hypothetical protein [Clostridium botulinum]|uniref:hypothetical protein n=1 Tax=Clostridium botulinum TaxID=1491 RepID=UPI0004D3D61B|nr:hypothetical protein [Clostridium botulinum]KEH90450.1 hypothetical protein Z963_p0004 [Clostridium botulinum C/D str. It1]